MSRNSTSEFILKLECLLKAQAVLFVNEFKMSLRTFFIVKSLSLSIVEGFIMSLRIFVNAGPGNKKNTSMRINSHFCCH